MVFYIFIKNVCYIENIKCKINVTLNHKNKIIDCKDELYDCRDEILNCRDNNSQSQKSNKK